MLDNARSEQNFTRVSHFDSQQKVTAILWKSDKNSLLSISFEYGNVTYIYKTVLKSGGKKTTL